jgi:hypothetical protein
MIPVSSAGQSPDRGKAIRKLSDPSSPIQIMRLKLKGQPRMFTHSFDADDDWIKNLSFEVKNVSKKEIAYFVVSLDFPADDSDSRFFTVLMEYGTQPQGGKIDPTAQTVKPGETVTVPVKPEVVDSLRRLVQEQGSGKALKMNRAKVYAYKVYFTDNTMWMLGTTSVRDPATGEWKEVGPTASKFKGKGDEVQIIQASFVRPININLAALSGPCYTTKTQTTDNVCCKTQDLDTYGTSVSQGNAAVWKQIVCSVDCSAKNFWYIGVTPGCPSTCKFSGEQCSKGSECCNGNCDQGLCAADPSPTPNCVDSDGDGYGVGPDCVDQQDCNDHDKTIYPGALETCNNIDDDCNGKVDDVPPTYEPGSACSPTPTPTPPDGDGSCIPQDCSTDNGHINGYWDPTICDCEFSPILIDISGNGFALTNAQNGVNFDLNVDGTRERLAWTAADSDDAWLVLDRNGNGVIDNGTELFGDITPQPPSTTPNGFLALAEYDKPQQGGNGDGWIGPRDAVFSQLRLWQDANHDGISQPEELHTLPSLGVMRIDLDYKESRRTDEYGNHFRYRAKVRDAHGAQVGRWAWDVFLVNRPPTQ